MRAAAREGRQWALLVSAPALAVCAQPAAALTSKIEKYLRDKPVLAVVESSLSHEEFESCVRNETARLLSLPAVAHQNGAVRTLYAFKYFIASAVSWDGSAPAVRAEARSTAGRAIAKACAGTER